MDIGRSQRTTSSLWLCGQSWIYFPGWNCPLPSSLPLLPSFLLPENSLYLREGENLICIEFSNRKKRRHKLTFYPSSPSFVRFFSWTLNLLVALWLAVVCGVSSFFYHPSLFHSVIYSLALLFFFILFSYVYFSTQLYKVNFRLLTHITVKSSDDDDPMGVNSRPHTTNTGRRCATALVYMLCCIVREINIFFYHHRRPASSSSSSFALVPFSLWLFFSPPPPHGQQLHYKCTGERAHLFHF